MSARRRAGPMPGAISPGPCTCTWRRIYRSRQGHIPGAVNRPWMEAFRPDGRWRPPAEQAERLAGLPAGPAVIHSCGSGVTACVNLLAMELAGQGGGRLYAGSWSDWCSYPENPVER